MEDLFYTQLCKGLQKPSQPRSVLQAYFESCYNPDCKYDTPPPTPPTKKHTLDRVEAVAGTVLTLDSNDYAGDVSLELNTSRPSASATQSTTIHRVRMAMSKKRKQDDEEEDHNEARQQLDQPRYRRLKHYHVSSPSMASLPQKPPPHRKPSRVDFLNQDKKLKHESDDKAPREREQQQLHTPHLRRSNRTTTSSASTPPRPLKLRPHARLSKSAYRGHVDEAKQHHWNDDDQAKEGLMQHRALEQKSKPRATLPEESQHKRYLLRTRRSRVLRWPH
jgi:hypothetical protein